MATEERTRKICNLCGDTKPIEQFRWKDKKAGRREGKCRSCSLAHDRKLAEEKKAALREEGLKGLVQQLRQAKIDAPHISEYVATLVKKLGGIDVLAQTQVDQIEMLLELKPGSTAAVNAIERVVKLIVASTENRDSAPDLAQITDEQLNELLLNQVTMRLAANANFLEDAAHEMGFMLVPLNAIDAVSVSEEPLPALPAPEPAPEAPDA